MTNKFEIGSQWKTCSGWRAVVVAKYSDGSLLCWHDKTDCTQCHEKDGRTIDSHLNGYTLSLPWKEPLRGELWLNIYESWHPFYPHKTREEADKSAHSARLACVNVKWTEGEGL